MAEFGIYFNIGTLIAMGIAIVGIARKFTQVEERSTDNERTISEVKEISEARAENLARDHKLLEREAFARTETLRLETGEMGAALRQKIHDVEMNSRDRIDEATSSIRQSIEKLGDRLEDKIDRAMQRREPSN